MIVVNTTYQLAPWADALYAMDVQWWRMHGEEVAVSFRGERISANPIAVLQVSRIAKDSCPTFGNSGSAAISIAALAGARKVILVGYDCQRTGGKVHWHGNHPKGLGNAGGMPKWPKQFADCATHMQRIGVDVINCTRSTALTCFPRGDLEEWLCKD